MQVQGSTVVNLKISNQIFQKEVIIEESLTTEGILGTNFLEGNGCVLDPSKGELVSHGTRISLCAQSSPNPILKGMSPYHKHLLLHRIVKWRY